MVDRYYLCRIIGRGTEDDSFRSEAMDVPGVERVTAAIATNSRGKPRYDWTVCRIRASDFSGVEALPDVVSLGSSQSLEETLSGAQRTDLQTKLSRLGEDLQTEDTNSRALVLRMIQRHYPQVHEVKDAFP